MANGIQERRSLSATFFQWLEEAKIPTAEIDLNKDGTTASQEIASYVLGHFEKFSPKVQKEIEELQKAFRALGFADDEAKKILTELPAVAAQRLLEVGASFEKKADAAKSEKNAKQVERAQQQATDAYGMALRLDPDNVEARISLAKLELRQGEVKEARAFVAEAILRADAKGLDAIVSWLETVPSSFLQKQSATQFVAKHLVEVCHYGEAKRLYANASAVSAQAGDTEQSEKYREKAWLAAELESPYRPAFDPEAYPEIAKLYDALRSSGVPSALLAGETNAEPQGKREISGAQLLQAIDSHSNHPGIQQGLEKMGLWPAPWEKAHGKNKLRFADAKEEQAFAAWPYTKKLSFYYAQQASLAKTDAEQERCLSLAAHLSSSAPLAQQLGDFYLQRKNWARAAFAYQSAVERDPKAAAARQGLKQALIAQGAWDQALKFLSLEEGQALVFEKLQEAGKLLASGESETAKPILTKCQAWAQDTAKARPEFAGTDPQLRVEALLNLYSGAVSADESKSGETKPSYERAIAAADQLLKKNPYDEAALLWRSQANQKLGNLKAALVDARLLSKLSPEGAKSLVDAGLFLSELENQYRDAFRTKYQDQLKEFQRFAKADTFEEKKQAFTSLRALNQLSQEFFAADWPGSNEVKLHEDFTLVRDFYTLRTQFWNSLGSMPFEGVTIKPDASLKEIKEDAEAKKQKLEKHQEFLTSIHYADQAAAFLIEANSLNGLLSKQRERLLGSLEPQDKCADPRAQLTKVRLAIQIDLDLGKLDYDHIVRDFEAWQKVNAEAFSGFTQDAKSFFENWQASWELALKLPMGNVAGGVFEPEDAILKKLRAVLRDPRGLKSIQEAYAKTGGPAWDQAAFDQLLRQLDEGFDVTKLKQLTPYISEAGLKSFFTKNERAKTLMAEAQTAVADQDLATGRGKALEALKIYGELGNAPALKKTIQFLETKTAKPSPDPRIDDKFPNLWEPIWESARYDPSWSGKRVTDAELKAYYFDRARNMDLKLDEASYAAWRQRVQEKTKDPKGVEIASARDSLELYWGMAQALKGSAISLPKEDLEARQQAFRKERDALKKKYPDTQQYILDGLMGPRRLNYEKTEVTFEDWMLEEARLAAADLNITSVMVNPDAVSEFGDKGRIESDLTSLLLMKSFYEWDGNQPQARSVDAQLKHNLAFGEERARNFIAASQKLEGARPSPKERVEGIERVGKILEADLILYRNLDLSKVEERAKFSIQVVGHLALLQQAVDANRDLPAAELLQVTQELTILTTSCKAFTETDTPIIQKEGLEGTVAAVAKLGAGVLQSQSLLFYAGLPEADAGILDKIRDLSPQLQGGILGYYFDRAKVSEVVRAEPLTETDWAAIEDIQKNSSLVAASPDQQIEQYLRGVGKFRPLNDQEIKQHDTALRDFTARWEEALQKGDTGFLANLNPAALQGFAARHLQAEQALAAAKGEVDFEKRLDRLGDAAQQFAELGLSKRVEEALAPVIENANSLQDKTQRGEWYLKLAHFYETTGIENRARDFYQQLSQLDPGKEPAELHQMAVYARGVLELLKEKPATDEAKLILSEIRDFPLAKEKLEAIDRDQHQRWVGVPYSFLAGILMAKVDNSQKIGGGGYALDLERKDEDFRIKAQGLLNELNRLCQPGGECQSLHQAMRKLKDDIRFVDVFVYLESDQGGGKDVLAYIEAMANPALTDKQMAGESLRLAEKLLDRENFDLAMQVSAMLKSNPYVTEQAKALVESRIPDAVKWKARKEAIWAAVKDILIVPAIVEGRYQDAGISAITTLLTFGVGKIFSSAAKVGWAAWSVRSLEVGGKVSQFAARFAAASPRLFRATEVVVVGLADNMGNVLGGRLANTLTGRESHVGFWHEFGLGVIPFAGIHATGAVIQNLGKRAEQITLLRATSEAEIALLKSQGKLALRTSARVGMEVAQQGGVAFSFAAGDWLNEKIGLAEEQNTPFGWRLFEKLPMSVQQWYGTRGVNFLSGGRLHYVDHVSDQKIQVASALAKLQGHAARGAKLSQAEKALVQAQHEALETYLIYYSDAAAAKRGKPLSSKELADEIGELDKHAQHLLNSVGLKSGPAFEAARLNLFTMAAQEGFSKGGDPRTVLGDYAKGLPDPKVVDQAAERILGSGKGSAADRDSLKSMLLMWALEKSKTPDQFQKNVQRLAETAPAIGESLRLGVEGLLGEGALQTEPGRKLGEQFLLRALFISERPGQVAFALETFAKQTPAYGQKIGLLLAASGLEGDAARLALVDWVLGSSMSLSSLDHLVKEMGEGKVLARFDGKQVTFEVVPEGQVAPGGAHPKVHETVQDRELTEEMRKNQENIQEVDAHGRKGHEGNYELDRGLVASSEFSHETPFGKIEDNVALRLQQMRAEGKKGPLKILTLGAGKGNMEKELKAKFGDQIQIDTFTLTDTIAAENRSGFSNIYLGNLDTHRIPQGYDLVVSIHGSFHALDQPRVLEQVLDSLNVGGEAFYTRPLHDAAAKSVLDSYRVKNYLAAENGVVFTENPTVGSVDFKPVYLKKTAETPPAQELLAKAQKEAKDPKYGGFYYQVGGQPKRFTPENYPQDVQAALVAFVLQKGYLSKRAAKEIPGEFLEFFAKTIQSDLQAGFTLEQAVARGEDVILRDLPGVKRLGDSVATPREPDEPKPESTKVERKGSNPKQGVDNLTGKEAPIPAAARSGQGQRVPDRIFETPARDSTSDASPGSRKKGPRKADEAEEVPVAKMSRSELDPAFPAAKIQEERPLQAGEYMVYTGDKLSLLSFNERFNQRQVALSDGEYLQFRVDPNDGALSVAYFGKGDLVIRDAQGNVRRFRGSNPGKPGHFEKLASGETIITRDQKVKIQSEADIAAELKVRGEIRTEREKLVAMRTELEKSRARGDDTTKIQEQEKNLAAAELAFREFLAKRQRTIDGESYTEVMPRVVQDIAGRVFDGLFPKEGTETGLFDGQGRILPEARIELRNQLLAELERRGIRISTDNAKSVDSILDLALTAKKHEIIDKPGGITRTQFFELVGDLYLHNNPELRIGAAELTHVPMVVAGTLDHYEVAMRGQGKKTRVADKKALFIAALLHDAGKWDGQIKTETGFTILKTSPYNKTGADIVVPPGKSLQEVLAEQKIPPSLVPLPFDGMVAILVHHDASNVHAEVQRLVKQGLLSPGEGEQAWQAIQYHGFVSSWIMKNSLGGLGIKSHVFDAAFDRNLVPYLEAYQRVTRRLGEKGIPDLETLMQEPQMAADVATMREAFRKLPPYVQALMLGDHQGQIDVAKYMTILSGVPANKDASIYDLFFGASMGNSLMGVLQTHRFEEFFHSLDNGQLADSAFAAAQAWLEQSDPKQAGLAQAIFKDPDLAASFEAWKKTQSGEVTVQDWLKTLKVKAGTANAPEFVKIQKQVEAAFYEFYALSTERPLDWREQAGLSGPPPPLSWDADVARKDRLWGEQIVGRILEYFGLPDTRRSLEAMEARQDALGEQARNFHRDLKKFEAVVQEYRRLEKESQQKPSPEKRTDLDQKWAEIDALAFQLDAAPYHKFEKEHAQEILHRVRDLEPLQQVLAIAQVKSSGQKKLHPDRPESFHYSVDYAAVERLTQYSGNWKQAPTQELLRFEGTVADWSVAEKILAEIQAHPGLKIVKGFQKAADGKSATVTVQVEGEKTHEVEIHFRLADADAATPLPSGAQPLPPPAPDDKAKRPASVPLPAAAAGGRDTTSRLHEDIPTDTTVATTPYGKGYLAMDEVNPDRLEAYRLFAEPSSTSALDRMPEGVPATVLATRWHPGEKGGPGKVEVFLQFGKTYRFKDNAVLHLSLEDAQALKIPVNKDGDFHNVSAQDSPHLFLAVEAAAQVKPQAQAAVLTFDAKRQQLYRDIPSVDMVMGRSGKSYSAREIEQLLYQVLERNQPLSVLPAALRPKVREYMRQVVEEAMKLFPEAGIGTADHNYFTGESLKKRYEETDISGDYRFARMLLNQKAGRPIFGEPSAAEQKDLVSFVQKRLSIPHVKGYEEARALLREQVFKLDPAARKALQEADPKLRNLVVDALFGDSQTLRVTDPRQAVAVAQFLGKLGFHREFSVSYNLGTQPPHAVLRLGDLTQVSQEPGEILFFHTHPVHLMDVRGGRRQGIQGNTLVLDYSEAKERSHSALFSDGDIDCFTHEAARLFKAGPNLKLPFYDTQNRVYKNWVQHPTGVSEIEVHLDSQGKVQAIKIRSGLYEGVDAAPFEKHQVELTEYIKSKYGLDAEVERVAPSEIEKALHVVAEPGSKVSIGTTDGVAGVQGAGPPVQGWFSRKGKFEKLYKRAFDPDLYYTSQNQALADLRDLSHNSPKDIQPEHVQFLFEQSAKGQDWALKVLNEWVSDGHPVALRTIRHWVRNTDVATQYRTLDSLFKNMLRGMDHGNNSFMNRALFEQIFKEILNYSKEFEAQTAAPGTPHRGTVQTIDEWKGLITTVRQVYNLTLICSSKPLFGPQPNGAYRFRVDSETGLIQPGWHPPNKKVIEVDVEFDSFQQIGKISVVSDDDNKSITNIFREMVGKDRLPWHFIKSWPTVISRLYLEPNKIQGAGFEIGGKLLPGAILLPHQSPILGYPGTLYPKLKVISHDTDGVITLAQEGVSTPLRFLYLPHTSKSMPLFVRQLSPGMEVDILYGSDVASSEMRQDVLPGSKVSAPLTDASDQVSVRPNWEVLSAPLANHQVPLRDLNANAAELPIFVGDPAKMHGDAAAGLVVQDGIHTEEPMYWGTLRREGNAWVFFASNNPQAQEVHDAMFLTKSPRQDGGYILDDQDRISLGFEAFQLRDGVLVPASQQLVGSGPQLSWHDGPSVPTAERAGVAQRYVEPGFTHGQPEASPEIFSGNVDYSRGIPVHVTPATAQSGEVAMATTQGRGKKGPSEDAILKLRGPKGELVVLDIDGIGGLANGDAAAVLAAEAFAAEYGRSGDSQRAWQFANSAIQRFNGEFKAALPKKKSEEISELEFAAAKKAGLAAARKMIADPSAGITGAMSDGSGAVAVELKVIPPEHPGDPHVVQFSWVGDARGMVLRRQSNGEWKWVYRTVDQGVPNRPGQTVAGVDYEIGGEGRTLMAALHPFANVVTNSLGSNPIAKPQGMEHGEMPDPNDPSGASPAGSRFAGGAALQKGDLALLGSDGFWENFGHTKIILELIKHADSAEAAVKTLSDEAHWRMGIMAQARRRQLPEVIPGLYRFERPEGILYVDAQGKLKRSQVLYINSSGAVYETPDSQTAVDHYKTDHFSLAAYHHVPQP